MRDCLGGGDRSGASLGENEGALDRSLCAQRDVGRIPGCIGRSGALGILEIGRDVARRGNGWRRH
jgi:hypothetical protein